MKELLKRKAIVEAQIFGILTDFQNEFESVQINGVGMKYDYREHLGLMSENKKNPDYNKIESVSLNLSVK